MQEGQKGKRKELQEEAEESKIWIEWNLLAILLI